MTKGWRTVLAALFLFPPAAGAQALAERVRLCESCHGPGGNSVTAMVPSIAAQPTTFLENTLVYYREGLRSGTVMPALAKTLEDAQITALAKHFAARKATVVATTPGDPALLERGARLAGERHCGQCHMPKFQGRDQMARLAGQREDYLHDAMVGYRDGKLSAADTTMTEVLYGMSDADLRALAHYMARAE